MWCGAVWCGWRCTMQVTGAAGASAAAQQEARNLIRDILSGGGEEVEAASSTGIQVGGGGVQRGNRARNGLVLVDPCALLGCNSAWIQFCMDASCSNSAPVSNRSLNIEGAPSDIAHDCTELLIVVVCRAHRTAPAQNITSPEPTHSIVSCA